MENRNSRVRRDSQHTRGGGGGVATQNSDLEVLRNSSMDDSVKISAPRSNNTHSIQSASMEIKSVKVGVAAAQKDSIPTPAVVPQQLNLPVITNVVANYAQQDQGAKLGKHGRDSSKGLAQTLELRGKDDGNSQGILMNQSLHNFKVFAGQQPTPKASYLPSLVGNASSPSKKETSDYVRPGSSGRHRENLSQTRTAFHLKNTGSNHQKTHSVDPVSNRAVVQFREELSDQYNVLNVALNTTFQHPQASVFSNYMMKVVQSVERRKKKQITNQFSLMNTQNQRLAALVDTDMNPILAGKKPSQLTNLALQNFNNQIITPSHSALEGTVELNRKLANKSSLLDETAIVAYGGQNQFAHTDSKRKVSSSLTHSDTSMTEQSSKKNQQLAIVPFHSVFQEPKATEQVAFLLKEAQRKDKIFIPLERAPDVDSALMYKEMKNAPDNHAGIVVFSKNGFVNVGRQKGQISNVVTNQEFITNGVNNFMLKDLPFFKKFHAMKVFKQWKYIMKWNAYSRKRQQLANTLHIAKPIYSERFEQIVPMLNHIRILPLVEIRHNVTYGKKQQIILEDLCAEIVKGSKLNLGRTLRDITELLTDLKKEIVDDDLSFDQAVKERHMMSIIKQSNRGGGEDLVVFTKQKRQKEAEDEQYRILKQRHHLYDRFTQFVLQIVLANLIEVQYENKRVFGLTFTDQRLGPQFEVSVCFNAEGQLDTDPSMTNHRQSFLNVFQNMEDAIYLNQDLIQFTNDMMGLLFQPKQVYYKKWFDHMKKTLSDNPLNLRNNELIFDMLDKDIQKCREFFIDQFSDKQVIYDFAKDWETNQRDKQISLEMSFYKQTWMMMDEFSRSVERIRNQNTKIGTILVETLSLKKYLAELPKKIVDSIRSNVTNTMETETKSLREELSKTSEILDQLPGSLNVYVEQVNTLKYVKEKQEEFSQKFTTIDTLHSLCKSDQIKIGMHLQQAIEEVQHLYDNLPKLQKRAQDGLNQNKDTMEKIMHSSSLVLSKKIKAFEKKYVETYLQDRTRIEDCAETLEELFKRSKAIHEIRSKVILYKEFMKLLYEEDPNKDEKMSRNKLQCTEDYEFINDLHKQTIKLWKMLLYWRKRRQMCYNTPFLTLDTNKIIRSINKINRYFDEKLSKNDFMKDKSRPLYKVVMLQVKETSLIIEFLKDLRRESLQQRHWDQIFNLIKAPHLKASTSFTIVNLREYHIQNYREEIGKIIEYANTELKYEKVFKSIKDEWEKNDLKIIPFKESMDSYILVQTETLTTSIEENLTTLETIAQSKYAVHIRGEIKEQIQVLNLMLKNLETWIKAQNHFIHLDPVLQSSSQLAQILKADAEGIGYGYNTEIDKQTTEFLDLRAQFKRIMWSSFKRPQAQYNLQIKTRIEVFEKLIKHFSRLEQKIQDFLEERRKAFPRFYFLTDSQFLDFLTLANSNQDFNKYISVLFQGASKLFINRIVGRETMRETAQLETFISNAIKEFDQEMTKDAQSANIEANLENSPSKANQANMDQAELLQSVDLRASLPERGSVVSAQGGGGLTASMGILSQTDEALRLGSAGLAFQPNDMNPRASSKNEDDEDEVSKTLEVLGFVSFSKELFLFEKPVAMGEGVERWLVKVERAMQDTISKQLGYAVSSFPTKPLDEWVLDYPQQIVLTTLHLIFSHEVNEILEGTGIKHDAGDEDQDGQLRDSPEGSAAEIKGGALQKERFDARGSAGQPPVNSASPLDEDEEDPGMAEYYRKKNELRQQQIAEEEEAKRKAAEEAKRRFEEANELPRDVEKERLTFIQEMFGRDFPVDSKLLRERFGNLIKEVVDPDADPMLTMSSASKTQKLDKKKTDYREIIMDNMSKKELPGLSLRLQFWINQIIKSIYRNIAGLKEKQLLPDMVLNSLQRLALKNIVAFLLYQRDIVDNLMQKNVSEIEDFEWQSQIRLFWTGIEPNCKVLCGGWSVNQQNEYLGTTPRLTLTPLTNRYFIFMSTTLREKAAVLINTTDSTHSQAGDIFEEFSSLCMIPFKKVPCSQVLQMKQIMQNLNGAALANFWVFFEGLEKFQLPYLQTLNKELQLLQQQFIIQDLLGVNQAVNQDPPLSKSSSRASDGQKIQPQTQLKDRNPLNNPSELSLIKFKPKTSLPSTRSLGIFATISSSAQHYQSLFSQLSASFRSVSFTRFNERVLLQAILKTEGFFTYKSLSRLSNDFLALLSQHISTGTPVIPLQPPLYSQSMDQDLHTYGTSIDGDSLLSVRDLRLAVKLASLLRDQEFRVYHRLIANVRESQMNDAQRLMYARLKKKEVRMKERELTEKEVELQIEEEKRIEMKCLKEGMRLVVRQKLFSQRYQGGGSAAPDDQYARLDQIEKLIEDCMGPNFEKLRREDEQDNMELNLIQKKPGVLGVLAAKKKSSYTGGPLVRKKSISNDDVISRYSSNVGVTELTHSSHKVTENRLFIEGVTKILKDIIDRLHLQKSNGQLRNCVNVLDLFRRSKAIVFVGPVCSGKTSILKIVSNALYVAFKVKLRTSVVNPATLTAKELYGSIEAFQQIPLSLKDEKQADSDFSKSGILQLILDVYEKERTANDQLKPEERQKIIQSIFFDSISIDQPLAESLLDFIEKTNKREVLSTQSTEYLMDYNLQGEIKTAPRHSDEHIPVNLPNGNLVLMPSDLYLFFETPSLKDASPPFISKVGLIVTEQDDLTWQHIFKRQILLFLKKQKDFFEEVKFVKPAQHLKDVSEEFLIPFIEKVVQIPRIEAWQYFNPKAAIIQAFNILNCLFFKVKEVVKQRRIEEDDEYMLLLIECERDVFWSNVLLSTVWSFGAMLPKDLKKPFEEAFGPFKRRFNMGMSSTASAQTAGGRARITLFDLYYNPEQLQWELMQENIDFKLKLQYDPYSCQLLLPTIETSQGFFMMDVFLNSGMRNEDNVLDNKHLRFVGPTGSGKSFLINSFLKRMQGDEKFQLLQIPMSTYVTIKRIKDTVEKLYYNKRRNLLEPKDKDRPIVLIIDDVHMQNNLKVNILEFLRTWCMSKGYYDMDLGYFKGIGNFTTVTAENSEYRRTEQSKFPGRSSQESRFLFYSNTVYFDEYDSLGTDRFKAFGQQWLTSKIWTTSKLINKYYVLIQNTVLAFLDKLRRTPQLHYASYQRLTSFAFFQRFCGNLIAYTLTIDDQRDLAPGQKEEDAIAQLISYEMMRVYADRVMKGPLRVQLIQKWCESFKQEFVGGASQLTPSIVDGLILGNYHDRLPTAYVKMSPVNQDKVKAIKAELKKKVAAKSNNPLLESYIETPNCIKEVFRISRILFKEQQHLILIGQPGCGKSEYLQLSAVLNDAFLFELATPRFGDTPTFIASFKRLLLSIVQLNRPTFVALSDLHHRDPLYIDWLYHFMVHYCNRTETFSLWNDPAFAASFIEHERSLYHASAIKKPQEPSNEQYLMQAMRKLQKQMHFVLLIEDMQSYFEWVGLFPQMEYMFEVAFMDDLSNEGYKQMTQAYLTNRDSDNSIFAEAKLTSAIVELKQLVKNNVLQCFYSPQMLKHTSSDEYMITSITEFIMASDTKLNGYLFSDGLFDLSDPHHRTYHYSLPVPTSALNLSRFISFLELFRYLFDYLSLSLLVRRNYYEAFLRKAAEFQRFFRDIKVRKSDLGGEGMEIGMRVAQLKDKIAKMRLNIAEREEIVKKRQLELNEFMAEMKESEDEVNYALAERDGALDAVIQQIQKTPGSEFLIVLSQFSKITEREAKVLELFSVLVDKRSETECYNRQEHNHFFTDRDELIAMLNERRNSYFDELCLGRFKDFITEVNPAEYKDRALLKYLYHYFFELFKKLNLRHTKGAVYTRIAQFKEQIQNAQFSLNYSQNYIRDRTNELNQLLAQYNEAAGHQQRLSSQVEEAEISHMRTEHIIDQIDRYCQRILGKMHKTKKRQESVLGDSLIMAASVVFLGWFSMKERKIIRAEMADYLHKTTAGAIKCSSKWTEKGGLMNSKLFKQVVKEYGINRAQQSKIIHTQAQGILSQETLAESLFTLMFAPSCPYISDPTGALQKFLEMNLAEHDTYLKPLSASDPSINTQLEHLLRSPSSFCTLHDLNDLSSSRYGLSQDAPLLTRLSIHLYNGFEHDQSLLKTPAISSILRQVHTTHASVNKRVQVASGDQQGKRDEGPSLSMYQVQIMTGRTECTLNSEYKARAVMLSAMDDDEGPMVPQGAAWIDIKQVMLKHFLPEECVRLKAIRAKVAGLEQRKTEINKNFESAFLLANTETLKNLGEYSILKQSVEEIKLFNVDKKVLIEAYQATLSEHPLLSSYANVISAMYLALKKLSQITGELTYTWDLFLSIIDEIMDKTLRELTAKLQAQAAQESNHKSSTSIIIDSQGRLAVRSTKQLGKSPSSQGADSAEYVDFTLDEEFFSTQVIPQVHSVVTSSIKVQLVHLYNLILAIKLAYKKKEISEGEIEFFFKQLFLFKGFEGWRNLQHDMIKMDDKVEKTRFLSYKRELIKIYPENGRKIAEIIEKEIGQTFSYREASRILNFRIFAEGSEFRKCLKMFEVINVGFLCPDHEFKTRLTQLVYEQLSSVFMFSEQPMKFHDFVKLAAWTHPIALIPHRSMNTLNAISSMASFFGLELELLRSSDLTTLPLTSTDPDDEQLHLIESNLQDYSAAANIEGYLKDVSVYTRLEVPTSLSADPEQQIIFGSACMAKVNVENALRRKDRLVREHEASAVGASKDPVKEVERAAKAGSWVMISSLRFPRYWNKVVEVLDTLRAEGKIKNTFRLFFDFQGYPQNEIPDSFLFAHSISFHLTPKNNSDSLDPSFQDIWTTCLDPAVLDRLTDYAPIFTETYQSQPTPKALTDQLQKNALKSLSDLEQLLAQEPYDGAMTLTDQQLKYIADDEQRDLYNQFIEQNQSVAESTAKEFTDQMKLNDDYMEAVQKQLAEDGDNFRRSEMRQNSRQHGQRFMDPAREITPYTKVNLGQKGQNSSKAGPASSFSVGKLIEEEAKKSHPSGLDQAVAVDNNAPQSEHSLVELPLEPSVASLMQEKSTDVNQQPSPPEDLKEEGNMPV